MSDKSSPTKQTYSKESQSGDYRQSAIDSTSDWSFSSIEDITEKSQAIYSRGGRRLLGTFANNFEYGFEKSHRQHMENIVTKKPGRNERDNAFLNRFRALLIIWNDVKPRLDSSRGEIIVALDNVFENIYMLIKSKPMLRTFTKSMNDAIQAINDIVPTWLGQRLFDRLFDKCSDSDKMSLIEAARKEHASEVLDLETQYFMRLLNAEEERLTKAIGSATQRVRDERGASTNPMAQLARLRAKKSGKQPLVVEPRSNDLDQFPPSTVPGVRLSVTPKSGSFQALDSVSSDVAEAESYIDLKLKNLGFEAKLAIIKAMLKSFDTGNNDGLSKGIASGVVFYLGRMQASMQKKLDKIQVSIEEIDKLPLEQRLSEIEARLKGLSESPTEEHIILLQELLATRQKALLAAIEEAGHLFAALQQANLKDSNITQYVATIKQTSSTLAETVENESVRYYYGEQLKRELDRCTALGVQAGKMVEDFTGSIRDVASHVLLERYNAAIAAEVEVEVDPLIVREYKFLLESARNSLQELLQAAEENVAKFLATLDKQLPVACVEAIKQEVARVAAIDDVGVLQPVVQGHQVYLLQQRQQAMTMIVEQATKLRLDNEPEIFAAGYQHDPILCKWGFNAEQLQAELERIVKAAASLEVEPLVQQQYIAFLQQDREILLKLMPTCVEGFNANNFSGDRGEIEFPARLEALDKTLSSIPDEQSIENLHSRYLLQKARRVVVDGFKDAEFFKRKLLAGLRKKSTEQQLSRVQFEIQGIENPVTIFQFRSLLMKEEQALQEKLAKARHSSTGSSKPASGVGSDYSSSHSDSESDSSRVSKERRLAAKHKKKGSTVVAFTGRTQQDLGVLPPTTVVPLDKDDQKEELEHTPSSGHRRKKSGSEPK